MRRAAADGDAVEHDGAGANPAVVFDHDPFGGDALVHDRPIGIREDVIDREQLYPGAEEHVVADADSTLTPHDRAFADERAATQSNAGLRQIAKVEDVQAASRS